jgi:hypothetical protein
MARIKIQDLPEDYELDDRDMRTVRGGIREYSPPAGVKGSYQPGSTRLTSPGDVERKVSSKELFRR